MKNLEFYYDELIEISSVRDASRFACSKGMKVEGREISHTDYIKWLNEEHQILDKEEKEYLGNVIRPFANVVKSIEKRSRYFEGYIVINYLENGNLNEICFPNLKDETMYKGMEENKQYTLEELDLWTMQKTF